MKKIPVLIAFIFCAVASFAQYPNNQKVSDSLTRYHIPIMKADSSMMLPVKDTLNNRSTIYTGALTVRPQDTSMTYPPVYMTNGRFWFNIGFGFNINDTIYTRLPIYVDYTSQPGKRIISFLQPNGIISGGIVTVDSCMSLAVTPVTYSLNYIQFNIGQTAGLVVAAADPTFDRIDAIIVDTFGIVSILTGTPSATPVAPQINPSSQIILTTITIPAGATCLTVGVDVIYDQNTGAPEWTPTTSGTVDDDLDNLVNPYHLTKADRITTYTDGSQLIFTKVGVPDTVKGGDVFKFYIYVISNFTNQIQAQWFNGSTAASNNLVLNPYFNVNDSNQYQLVVVPMLSAWNFSGGNVYNKLVLTFAGDDVTGAKGIYLDWIQVQQGLTNVEEPPPPAWLISGNNDATPPANFLGTTNPVGLMFKVNNVQSGYLDMNFNTSFGRFSANNITTGFSNVALGYAALFANTTGIHNIGVGYKSLFSHTTGSRNVALGYEALYNNTTQSYNIGLGYQFDNIYPNSSNMLSISDSTHKMYMRIDTATGTAPSVIGYNPVTGLWNHYVTPSGGGSGFTTADNGLTANTATNVRLGGTLLVTTNIATGANTLNLTTSTAATTPLNVTATTGNAITSSATSGAAVYGSSSTNGYGVVGYSATGKGVQAWSDATYALQAITNPAAANTVLPLIAVQRQASGGVGANGIGGSIDYLSMNTVGTNISNRLISKWTDATTASRTSQFDITGVNNAVAETQLSLLTGGQLQLPQYVTANFNGGVAADSVLVITSTGIVKKRDAASFGGSGGTETWQQTLINGSTLTQDNTIDLGGNRLQFGSGDTRLYVDETANNEQAGVQASNNTDDDNDAYYQANASDVESSFHTNASFNGGIKSVDIQGIANSTTSTITHTADTHIFNGDIVNAADTLLTQPEFIWAADGDTLKKFPYPPLQDYYGTIYERTAFADTTGWSTNGASATFTGNKINLTGGTGFGDFVHSVDYNYYTCLDNFVIESKIIVGTVGSTSYGIGIGVRSTNTLFPNSVAAVLDLTNTATAGKISFTGDRISTGPTLSSTGITFVAGDTIYQRLERRGSILTFYVKNYNSYPNAPLEIQYSLQSLLASAAQPPNTGKFAIFSLGGTHSAYAFKVYSNDNLNIEYAILGDSKSLPIGANTYTSGWPGQLNPYINMINLSGTGDRIQHVLNRLPEILAIHPKTAIIAIGRNDVAAASGTVTQALKDSMNALNNYLHAAGIKTLFLRPFYESSTSMASFDAWMVSNFPDSNLIDTYTPTLKIGGAGLLADSVHQKQLGQNQTFSAIRTSGKIQGLYQNKNATIQNSGVNTYVPFYNGNNQLGFASSFTFDSTTSLQLLSVGSFKAFKANTTYTNVSLNGSTAAGDVNFLSGTADFNLYINRRTGSKIIFRENNTTPNQLTFITGGLMGLGVDVPTSWLHLKAGSKVANTAPLGFTTYSVSITASAGNGTTATLTFAALAAAPFAVGDTIVVTGFVTPSGYNGTYAVTACNTTTVSYLNATTGSLSSGSPFATQGQKLTTPVAGKMEWDGDNFYGTDQRASRSMFAMWAYVAKTGTYTATLSDYTIDCTSGTFTVTLPNAVGQTGRVFIVKNSGVGVITMAGTLSQTFDGAASPTIIAGAASQWQSTGANWIKIN